MSLATKGIPKPSAVGKKRGKKYSEQLSATWTPEMKEAARQRGLRYAKDKDWLDSVSNWAERNPRWAGGISKYPYPPEFSSSLRRRIRERDNNICGSCGIGASESRMEVHHIDYNKANNTEGNLITLCHRCNCAVNKNREKWTRHFSAIMGQNIQNQLSGYADLLKALPEVQ